MLEISLELNRAITELIEFSESLGDLKETKTCDLDEDGLVHACIKLLKCYEFCVRIDEALLDIMRHKDSKEIKHSIERAVILLSDLVDTVKGYNQKEKTILLSYMQDDFKEYYNRLKKIPEGRPSARIWEDELLVDIVVDFTHAIEALRRSSARAVLMVGHPEIAKKFLGKFVC